MAASTEDIPTIEETVSRVYVFNQYYWDFIKKMKDFAKAKRNTESEAKHVHNTIKQHYAMFDKVSQEHFDAFKANLYSGTWKAYQEAPVESLPGFFEEEPHVNAVLLKGDLTFGQLHRRLVAHEKILLHQYFTLFGILSDDTTDVPSLLVLMKQFKLNKELNEKLAALPEESGIKTPLVRLYAVYESLSASPSNPFLDEIEQTSLGKLAKEIMSEVNLDDLQPDMLTSGGGLMDMLTGGGAGGNGGLAKIISTVSQKMVSKMSSGELNQEDLLKDALGVAAKLPGMMPGGLGADLSKMGDMLSMLSGASGASGSSTGSSKNSRTAPGGFDLSSLMSMMGGLGGLGGGGGGMPNLTKKQMEKASRDGRVKSKLSSEMKRQKMAEKLRKKVEERNKSAGVSGADT